MSKTKTKAKAPPTIAADIDKAFKLRDEYRALQQTADAAKARFSEAETTVLQRLRAEGLEKASGSLGTVSVSESEEPTVEPEGWPKVWEWIYKNRAFEMLQKRLSAPAWRERRDAGITVPGTTTFLNVRLNMRSK